MTTLTTNNADSANKTDGGTVIKRSWTWNIDADTVAVLVHSRSQYATRGGSWTASLTVWPQDSEDPTLERYSPWDMTKARAMQWLNAEYAAL
jgi:hypothetical protein